MNTERAGRERSHGGSLVFVACLIVPCLLAWCAAPAGAARTHMFEGTFGSTAQPSFSNAAGLAVDQASGDLLVLDLGVDTVSRFKPNGEPDPFTALGTNVIDGESGEDTTPQGGLGPTGNYSHSEVAVDASCALHSPPLDESTTPTCAEFDPADGDIYVTRHAPGAVDVFSSQGKYLGQLTQSSEGAFGVEIQGVAVGSSGALYVADFSNKTIHVFTPTSNSPYEATNTTNLKPGVGPSIVTIGAGPTASFVFARASEKASKIEASSPGALKYQFGSKVDGVAADPGSGHVYAINHTTSILAASLREYDVSEAAASEAGLPVPLASNPQGIAVDGASHDLYITRAGDQHVEVYGPLVTVPEPVTGSASAIEPRSAMLNGTVDPDGVPLGECAFQYGTSAAYGEEAACEEYEAGGTWHALSSASEVPTREGPVPVRVDVGGLELGAEYHFRLVAGNANTPSPRTGEDKSFKLLSPPTIAAEWTVDATTTEATVAAEIVPEGFATTYHVEYGTSAAYGQSTPESAPIGADHSPHTVTATLGDLAPDTVYHWRVVADNQIGEEEAAPTRGPDRVLHTYAPSAPPALACTNALFRGGPGAFLADCRAYEMVSPIDKEGDQITAGRYAAGDPTALDQSAVGGDKLTYSAEHRFADAVSRPRTPQYIATRTAAGWSTHALSPPRGVIGSEKKGSQNEFKAFSADLCEAWLAHDPTTAPPLSPLAREGTFNAYRRQNCGAEGYEWRGAGYEKTPVPLEVQGIAADGGMALLRTAFHLSQDAATAVGAKLECETPASQDAANAIAYRWLRDGAAIAGAESATYTATAADEGHVVQCQVTATASGAGSTQIANPAWAIAPYPVAEPPLAPRRIAAPSASAALEVGGVGGQTLSCDPGEWEGSPSFEYAWYRNGAQVAPAGPQPTYAISAGDLATPAAFQCEVLASNAGGTVAEASESALTSPSPGSPAIEADPLDEETAPMLYLSDREGEPRSVCVLPSGALSTGCWAGTQEGTGDPAYATWLSGAISADGERVYWTPGNTFGGAHQIYLREEAGRTSAHTVAVSAGNAFFWGASSDGERAVYESGTLNSAPGALYEWDAADEETNEIAPAAKGVLGMSSDATKVYFASNEALTGSEENSAGQSAVEGQPNLYLHEAGEGGGRLAFVARLSQADATLIPSSATYPGFTPLSGSPMFHAARVSPDGGTAVFVSTGRPTGYDNTDAASGEADLEVYRYEAATGTLACVSCNPTGARPHGRFFENTTSLKVETWMAARIPAAENQNYFARALSSDGKRVFFESFDALSLRDTDGTADVYEWEAPGAGSCTPVDASYSEQDGGCLYLVSSGRSPYDSQFLDADPTGENVFFRTGQSLVASDPGGFDAYDARIGGGIVEPAAAQPCEGDACQATPSAPSPPTPASSVFEGPGNVREGAARRPKRCPKGKRKVRRKGKVRCVKPHRKEHKRHAHRKEHKPHAKRHRNRTASHDRGTGR